jgi:serine/threonine-protein kinase
MVTGRVPYDAESPVSVALKHIQEPVVPPKQLNGNIPDSMNSLILKAIEKEPIRRYQTVKDMLMDLHRIKNNSNCIISKDSEKEEHTRIMQPVSAEDLDDDEYDDEVEEGNSRVSKKTKRILIGVLIVILVSAIGITAGVLMSKAKNNPTTSASNKDVTIPTIKNMTEADAKKALEDKGLKYVLGGKENGSQPAGTVIAVSPDEGTSVKANSEVRVVLSNGPKKSKVPPVKELDISQARDMITSSGYKVGNREDKFSDTIPKNCVISQDPEGDSEAAEGTTINLVVSKGPDVKYAKVPNIMNKSLDEATAILNAASLKMGNQNKVDTSDPNLNNKVKSQSIDPGAANVKEQTPIDVTYYVYKAPEMVDVTSYVGKTLSEAKAYFESKGLVVEVLKGNPTDLVIDQNPLSGKIAKGSKITLTAQAPETTTPPPTTTTPNP